MEQSKARLISKRVLMIAFLGYTAIWTALLLVSDIASILFIPSDLPDQLAKSSLPVDKIVHCTGYFLLTFLAALALDRVRRATGLWWLAGFAALHGAATEVAQLYVPNRSGDVLDWVADVTGVAAAVGCVLLIRRVTARPVEPTGESPA